MVLVKPQHTTVEPVLGTLINFMGIKRIWTRGITGANKFMIAAAVAYNLKKWLNYKERKVKTAVIALKKGKEAFVFLFLAIRCFVNRYNFKI